MAKKTPAKKGEPGSFSQLNDFLNTIAPDGEILDINPIAKIDEWIPTGSYILNAALSGSLFGGLPNRRSLVLAGEEGTGKTFIALSIVRNAQKMGYDVIYFDSEGAIDIDFVAKLGVDTSRVRLQPVNTVEEFSHIAAQLTKNFEELKAKGQEPPKIMVVLDSLGNLSSEKEKDDTTEGVNKRDMTKQQAIRKLFRVNGLKFAKLGIPFIVNNHVYDSMSMFTSKEISGGGGVKYNASIIFQLGKGKLDDSEGEKKAKEKNVDAVRVGVTIYVTPVKQRFAKPIKVQLHIPFYKSPNPFVGLEPFVSWESVGIIRGRCIKQKDFDKLSPTDQKKCKPFEVPPESEKDDGKRYAAPNDKAHFLVCKHLNGEVPLAELFTDKVFTKELLEELDEKVIKPTFMLPSIESLDDLAEITKEMTDEGDQEGED
jgi:RecA/RadA recombinase